MVRRETTTYIRKYSGSCYGRYFTFFAYFATVCKRVFYWCKCEAMEALFIGR